MRIRHITKNNILQRKPKRDSTLTNMHNLPLISEYYSRS
jgi:hypothetical protein